MRQRINYCGLIVLFLFSYEVFANEKISKKIGSLGGELVTQDGKVSLVFPPRSLDSDTDISIELSESSLPNTLSNSIIITPSNLKLNQSALLSIDFSSETQQDAGNGVSVAFKPLPTDSWKKLTSAEVRQSESGKSQARIALNQLGSFGFFADCTLNGKRAVLVGGELTLQIVCVVSDQTSAITGTQPLANSSPQIRWTMNEAVLAAPTDQGYVAVDVANSTRATYMAPQKIFRDNHGTVRIGANIRLPASNGSNTEILLRKQVRVLAKNWTLYMDTKYLSVCGPIAQGTPIAAYSLESTMARVDFKLNKQLSIDSISDNHPSESNLYGLASCVPDLYQVRGNGGPDNVIQTVQGSVDPDTGIFTFRVSGKRTNFPNLVLTGPGGTSNKPTESGSFFNPFRVDSANVFFKFEGKIPPHFQSTVTYVGNPND